MYIIITTELHLKHILCLFYITTELGSGHVMHIYSVQLVSICEIRIVVTK